MTIRYVLHPSTSFTPNYYSVTGALTDAVSGDEIHIHNSNIDPLVIINFYIDNSQVILAFNKHPNAGFDEILNNSSANFKKSDNNIYYNSGSVMIGPESVFYTTSVAAFNEAYRLKVHGGAKFQAGNVVVGSVTETGTEFSEHLRIDTLGNLRIGLTEQTLFTVDSSTGNLMVTGTSILNNSVTLSSSLNVSGNTVLGGALRVLGAFRLGGSTAIDGDTNINGATTLGGPTNMSGAVSAGSGLNVSGNTVLISAATLNSTLNVSGETTLLGNTTLMSQLNVSGETTLLGNTTIVSQLNVSGETTLLGNMTAVARFNVSGESTLMGAVTMESTLNVSGETTLLGNTTAVARLNVSGNTTLQGPITAQSTMNVVDDFTYSARLVKNGFTMIPWVDNSEAPVAGGTIVTPTGVQAIYGAYIDVAFSSAKVHSYIMMSDYGCTILKWTIAGSNNLTDWFLLDSQENYNGSSYSTSTNFRDTTYQYVRFIVRKVDSHYNVMCQRFCLYDENGNKINISLHSDASWRATRGFVYYQNTWAAPVNSDWGNNMYLGSNDYDTYNNGWDGSYTGGQNTSIATSATVTVLPTVQGATRIYELAMVGIGMSTPTTLLNVSGTTLLEGATTVLSTFNVSGETTLKGSVTMESTLNVSGETTLLGDTTAVARLNVSGETTLLGNMTAVARLNISGETTLLGDATAMARFNVSGETTLLGNTTLVSQLNVSGETTLLGNTTLVSQLNVSGETTLLGNMTAVARMNVSGETTLMGAVTMESTLNVSGETTLLGNMTAVARMNVSGETTLLGNTTLMSQLNVSGKTTLEGFVTMNSRVNINDTMTVLMRNFAYSFSAGNGGSYGTSDNGGGAGGIIVQQNGTTINPTDLATNGDSGSSGNGADAGVGFGAGGGGAGSNVSVTTTNVAGTWAEFDFGYPRTLGSYNYACINQSSMIDWTIVGSNDRTTWHLIDSVTNASIWLYNGSGGYNKTIQSPYRDTAYRYMRWIGQRTTDHSYIFGHYATWRDANGNILTASSPGHATYSNGANDVLPWDNSGTLWLDGAHINWLHVGNYGSGYYSGPTVTPVASGSGSNVTLVGGTGANGFVYVNIGNVEHFTQSNGTYTFPLSGMANVVLVGGGAGAGNSNNGGGAGMIETYSFPVTVGDTMNITIGSGGAATANGSATSITINSSTYSANGGLSSGSGSASGGNVGVNGSSSQGAPVYNNINKILSDSTILFASTEGVTASSLFVIGASTASSTLNVSGETTLLGFTTLMSQLNVSGKTTLVGNTTMESTLNVSGETTLLGNMTAVARLNVSGETTLKGYTTMESTLNVSGETTLLGNTTLVSQLNVSGETTLLGNMTAVARFNVSGESTLKGYTTMESTLNVSGETTLLGNTTAVARFNVSGETTLLGDTTAVARLNVSGETTLLGDVTAVARFNVSGETTLLGNTTIVSQLNVSGETTLLGDMTAVARLNVSGNTTLQGPITALSTMNVVDDFTYSARLVKDGFTMIPWVDNSLPEVPGSTIITPNASQNYYGAYIDVSFNSAKVHSYVMMSDYGCTIIKWTIAGSNNMTDWFLLDSRESYTGQNYSTAGPFIDTHFNHVRFIVRKVDSHYNVMCQRFCLYDENGNKINISLASDASWRATTGFVYYQNTWAAPVNSDWGNNMYLGSNDYDTYNNGWDGSYTGGQYTTIVPSATISISAPTPAQPRIYELGMVGIGKSAATTLFNVSGTTLLEGATTVLSTFNVSGETTLVGDTTAMARFNVSGETTLLGNTTLMSQLNVSGMTTLLGAVTMESTLNVSGETTLLGDMTAMARMNVSGETTLLGNTTLVSQLNVSGETTLLGDMTAVARLNVSGETTLLGNTTAVARMNVSGETTLLGAVTMESTLNVSGETTLLGDMTAVARLNVSGETTLLGNTTLMSQLNVSGKTTLLGDVTMESTLNVSGETTLLGNTSLMSQLNVSGMTTLVGAVTMESTLNVSGESTLLGDMTAVARLNVSGETTLLGNTTLVSQLNVSGETTLLGDTTLMSQLNVSGKTTLLGNVTMESTLNVSGKTTLLGNVTMESTLNVSGETTLLGNVTMESTLNVSGETTLKGFVTMESTLGVSGETTLQGDTTLLASLYVSGETSLLGNMTAVARLNVSGETTLLGNMTAVARLNVSGESTLMGAVTMESTLNVSGETTLLGNTTLMSQLNVSGETTLLGDTTLMSQLNVSGKTTLLGNVTMESTLNVSGETTLLGDVTMESTLNVSGETTLLGNTTLMSQLNVSGKTNLLGSVTMESSLNVSGETTLLGNTTAMARLNVSGETLLLGNATLMSQLNVSGKTTLLGNTTAVARFNVSGESTLLGNMTAVARFNVSGESTLLGNMTAVARLNVSGESTLLGNMTAVARLNVSGESTLLGNTTIVSQLNVSGKTTLLGDMTAVARFNVSGESTLLGNTTLVSQLNVSGKTTLLGDMTAVARLNVSGESTLLGNTTLVSQLNVSGETTLLGNTTAVARLNVSGETTLLGNMTAVARMNVSGETTLMGAVTMESTLNVSGETTLLGNMTAVARMNVSGETTLLGNTTLMSQLNVSGKTTLQGAITAQSTMNVVDDFTYSARLVKNGFTMIPWVDNSLPDTPASTLITPSGITPIYGAYIDVSFNSAKIYSYVMMSDYGSTIIKWTIAGSNNMTDWFLLDSRESYSGSSYSTTGNFRDTNFQYVRFIVRKIDFHYNVMCQRFCLYDQNGNKVNITLTSDASWRATRGFAYYQGTWANPVNSDSANNMYLGSNDYDSYNNGWDGSYTGSQNTSIATTAIITNIPAVPGAARVYELGMVGIGKSAATTLLNVSGTTLLEGATTILSTLNVSGETKLIGNMTTLGRLNVSGESVLLGNTTMVARFNVSGETTLLGNMTAAARLNVSGESVLLGNTTLMSQLNVSGKTNILGDMTAVARLNVSGETTLLGNTTIVSQLNVSGNTTMYGPATMVSSLNVSGNTVFQGTTLFLSSILVSGNTNFSGSMSLQAPLSVAGNSSLQGNTTVDASLHVSGESTLVGNVTVLSRVNVSGETTLQGNTTLVSQLNVSGETTLLGNMTAVARMNVSGETTLLGNTTMVSQLNVSGETTLLGNATLASQLNVSGNSTMQGDVTMLASLNVSGISVLYGASTLKSTLSVMDTVRVNTIRPYADTITGPSTTNETLNIIGHYINIGDSNSVINIQGTTTSVFTNQIIVEDPLLVINSNNAAVYNTQGNDSGIQIDAISSTGYLKTTADATKFVLKAPQSTDIGYIVTKDNSDNLTITGTTYMKNAATVVSTLNVSGTTNLSNSATIKSTLFVSGNTILQGAVTTSGSLNVSGVATIQGATTMQSTLNVIGNVASASEISAAGRIVAGGELMSRTVLTSYTNPGMGNLKLVTYGNQTGDQWWIGFGHGGDSSDSNDRARIGVNIKAGGAGRLVFSTGFPTSENMRLDEYGQLGIGTSAPTQKLEVAGGIKLTTNVAPTNDNNAMYMWNQTSVGPTIAGANFQVQTGGNVPRFHISSSGNVGINTTSPGVLFDVNHGNSSMAATRFTSSGPDATISLKNTGTGGREYWVGSASNGAGGGSGNFYVYDYTAGSVRATINSSGYMGLNTISPSTMLTVQAAPISTFTGASAYGGIHIQPTVNTGNTDYATGITWSATESGNYGTHAGIMVQGGGSYGTKMYFQTTNGWGLGTQNRMMIDHNGNVGIGTTAPGSVLDVRGNTRVGNLYAIRNGAFSNGGYVTLIPDDTAHTGYIEFRNADTTRMAYIGYGDANAFNISVDQARALIINTNSTERMRITSGGYVGIGTSTPSAPLTVSHSDATKLALTEPSTGNNYITFSSNGAARGYVGFENSTGTGLFGSNSAYGMSIGTNTNGGALAFATNNTIRGGFDTNGNMGINTLAPSANFHVSGTSLISGAMTANSTLNVNGTMNVLNQTVAYTFTAGNGGAAGTGNSFYNGGGGAGGIIVQQNGVTINPSSMANNGSGSNGGAGGGAGVGFGAGGGGGGFWFAMYGVDGGRGANGFVYINIGGSEYFTQASGSYTFTSSGTAKIIMIGGGGSGGNNGGSNNLGGGGGGAGYIQTYTVSVTSGQTATITVGSGGTAPATLTATNGGTTSVVIGGTTYSANGGGTGTTQSGGAGSSTGGAGGYGSSSTAGYSGGNGATGQGTSAYSGLVNFVQGATIMCVTTSGITATSIFVSGATTTNSTLNVVGSAVLANTATIMGAVTMNSSLNVSGTTTITAPLTVSGTAKLGNGMITTSWGSDMTIAHKDVASLTTNFALYQSSVGDTVINSASGYPIYFKINNVEKMRLESNGNFGLGTVPAYKMDVNGIIRSNTEISVVNTAVWDHLRLWHDGSIAYFDAGGADNGISFRTVSGNSTYPATTYYERMRILDNGNVGINISNPQTKLDIYDSTNPKIYLTNPTSRAFLSGMAGYLDLGNDSGTNSVIRFMPNGSESIRIANNGYLGIGTSAPVSRAEVYGTEESPVTITRSTASTNYGAAIRYSLIDNSTGFRGYYAKTYGGSYGATASSNQNQASGYYAIDVANSGSFGIDSGITTASMIVTAAQTIVNTPKLSINTANAGVFNLRVNGSTHLGDQFDPTEYGKVQITRPANQGDNKHHLSFIRYGQRIFGMGFLNNSDTFGIQYGNDNSVSKGIFIQNNGYVGVGGQTPRSMLDVRGTLSVANNNIQLATFADPSDTYMAIDTWNWATSGRPTLAINAGGGNVGINTYNSSAKFTVTVPDAGANIGQGNWTDKYMLITNDSSGSNAASGMGFSYSSSKGGVINAAIPGSVFTNMNYIANAHFMSIGGSNTNVLTVASNGNVGIGTTGPTSLLHVAGTATVDGALNLNGAFNISGVSIFGSGVGVQNKLSVNSSSNLALSVTANGESYDLGVSAKDNYLTKGTIGSIYTTAAIGTPSATLIDIATTNNNKTNNVYYGAVDSGLANGASNFVVGRRTGAQSWTESMRIDTNGYMGINTTTPNSRLHVSSGSSNVTGLKLSSSGAGWGSGLVLENSTATTGKTYGMYSGSEGNLHIADVDNSTDRMVITNNGNVGIGIQTATSKLHINAPTDQSGLWQASDIRLTYDAGAGTSWDLGRIAGYVAAGANNSTSNWPGGMLFQTKPATTIGAAAVTRMVIDSQGYVGIGNSAPLAMLHVSGNSILTGNMTVGSTLSVTSAVTMMSSLNINGTTYHNNNITINQPASSTITPNLLFAKTSDDSSGGGLGFYYNWNGVGNRQLCFVDTSYATKNTTNSMMRFGNASSVTGMYIDSVSTDGSTMRPLNLGGNPLILNHPSIHQGQYVGISTTTPSATLHVSGNTKLEGPVTCNSTLNVASTATIMGSMGVGIVPNAKLHVSGPANTVNMIIEDGTTNITFKSGAKFSTATPGWTTIDPNGGSSSGVGIYDNLAIWGGMAVGTATEPGHGNMLVSGTMGVGTNSASATLHVNGTSLVTGAATFNSSLYVSGPSNFVGSMTLKGYGSTSFPGFTIASDQTTRFTTLFNVTAANSGVTGSSVGDTILCTGDTGSPVGNVYIQRTTGYNPVLTATVGGSVGINNVTPTSNFHVIGTSILQGASTVSSTLNVSGTSTFNNTMVLTNNTSALSTYLQLKNYGATGGSQITFYNNADNFAYINFGGTSYAAAPNSLNLGTYGGGGMTITGAGLFGIGTATPGTKLNVYSAGSTSLAVGNSLNSIGTELCIASSAGDYSGSAAAGDSVLRSNSGKLILQTGYGNCAMAINTSNYVGINTNNPTSNLTVVGTNNGNDVLGTPATAEFKSSGAFDDCTVVRIDNNASSFGRTQLQIIGRYQGNNDGWEMTYGRTNLLFRTRVTSGSTITTNFALQNNGISRFGILSSFNPNYPALTVTSNNNYVGINNDTPSASLHVSGTSIMSGAMTASSTLNVAGNSVMTGTLSVGSASAKGIVQSYNANASSQFGLTLTGYESYKPGDGFTSADGIGLSIGVNRTDNRQLWISDTAKAMNTTNTMIRIMPNNGAINATSTDGTVEKVLRLGGSGIQADVGMTAVSSFNVSGTTTLAGTSVNLTAIPNSTSNNNYVLTYNNSTGAVGYNSHFVTQLFNNQGQSWSSGVTSGQVTLGANSKLIQGTVTYYTTAVILAQVSLIFSPVGGGTSYTFNFNKFFNFTYAHMEHTFTLALTNSQLPAGTYTCQAIASGPNSSNMGTDTNDQIMIAITNLPN